MAPGRPSLFQSFEHDIDLETPFGLKMRIEAEGDERESGVICLLPRMGGPPLHRHTAQEEEFSVIRGELFVRNGRQRITLRANEGVRIDRNCAHTYANRSNEVCIFRYALTPGRDFTRMMREFERLARLGKLRRLGAFGTMVHIAGVITDFQHHVRSVNPPHLALKVMGSLRRFLA